MIEPLRYREEFSGPDEAEAARLLRTWGPADPLPVVEQRVYASLARPRRFGPRALRFASVISISVVATGVFALSAGMVLRRETGTRAPAVPPSARPVAIAAPVAPVTPQATPVVVPQPSVRAVPRTPSRSGSPRPSLPGHRQVQAPAEPASPVAAVMPPAPAADPVETTEARVAAAPPEEAALVLAGLRALRRQHDPAQAGVLLARYLNRFPQGALVQEALAIAIEAGIARGDRQTAAQLATQYLERFPAGRFVRLARKAADGTGP
jgi:hypothetical protein